MINIRNIAKNNTYTRKCRLCECAEVVFGRIWCNCIDDYISKDYDCAKETNEFLYKCTLLVTKLCKSIKNITWTFDGEIAYIEGFGYTEAITPANVDLHLNDFDNFYKKWYCRWCDAYSDELAENSEEINSLYRR